MKRLIGIEPDSNKFAIFLHNKNSYFIIFEDWKII